MPLTKQMFKEKLTNTKTKQDKPDLNNEKI